jgi:hypothetical protein
MHTWIFVVFLTVASLGPYLSRYDNPDAEWAELASDETASDQPAEMESSIDSERA